MTARRIIYITLLVLAAVLHFAYGQYVTFYLALLLLCVPIVSALVSIPAALAVRLELRGGGEICRGRRAFVFLDAKQSAAFPPDRISVTVEARNSFTGSVVSKQRVKMDGSGDEKEFEPDTSELGVIKYRIKRAFVFDRLGLVPIPVKRGGAASVTVLPDRERPEPEPDLVIRSQGILKPKPQSFAEEHELRPYRDGDPMNLVHWKLTRKMDEIIVREPQEATRKAIVLLADLPEEYEQHRSILEQIRYLNDQLSQNGIPYTLQYGETRCIIDSENAFDDFIGVVLSERMRIEKAPSADLGSGVIVCRIDPNKEAAV